MPYTSADQVSLHLVQPLPTGDVVQNLAIVMSGSEYIRFHNQAIISSSLAVKSVQADSLIRISLNLSDNIAQLPDAPIAADSVVLASDSSLGTIYTANYDYTVDAAAGKIMAKNGGRLSNGQLLTAWYFPFHLYLEGSDYALQSSEGRIRRLVSGDIADGESVLLDFQPVSSGPSDDLVNYAVSLANGMIEREIDPEGQFEADPMLNAAATYRALEIVARAGAAKELGSLRGEDRTATVWLKLADDYALQAKQMLTAFRPPARPTRSPQKS